MTREDVMALTGRELDAAVLVEYHGWKWMQRINESQPSGLGLCALIPPVGSDWERINWRDSDWREGSTTPEPYQRFTDWYGQGLLRGGGPPVIGMPAPTTNANAIEDMQTEIGRRGLMAEYVMELRGLNAFSPFIPTEIWRCMTAPLETKCRAALLAVLGDKAP